MRTFFFLLLIPSVLLGVTINIINDSPYPLEARIYSAQDEILGTSTIYPNGHSYRWMDSYHGATDWSEGPFTIRFFCPAGEEFGRIYHVTDGMTVRSQGALGSRRCSQSD